MNIYDYYSITQNKEFQMLRSTEEMLEPCGASILWLPPLGRSDANDLLEVSNSIVANFILVPPTSIVENCDKYYECEANQMPIAAMMWLGDFKIYHHVINFGIKYSL